MINDHFLTLCVFFLLFSFSCTLTNLISRPFLALALALALGLTRPHQRKPRCLRPLPVPPPSRRALPALSRPRPSVNHRPFGTAHPSRCSGPRELAIAVVRCPPVKYPKRALHRGQGQEFVVHVWWEDPSGPTASAMPGVIDSSDPNGSLLVGFILTYKEGIGSKVR